MKLAIPLQKRNKRVAIERHDGNRSLAFNAVNPDYINPPKNRFTDCEPSKRSNRSNDPVAVVVRVIQDCVFWNTYKKTATLRLASKWISELNTIIGAMAPARRADKSPMKPAAHTMVSKVMPIKAKSAAFLRVMAGVYTYRF
jgi:hypothetical protein